MTQVTTRTWCHQKCSMVNIQYSDVHLMFSGSKVPGCHFTEPTLKNHAYLWLNLWPNETQSLSINTWNKKSSIKGDYWGFIEKQKIMFLILINWIIKNNPEISQSEKTEWDNPLLQAYYGQLATSKSLQDNSTWPTRADHGELATLSCPRPQKKGKFYQGQ